MNLENTTFDATDSASENAARPPTNSNVRNKLSIAIAYTHTASDSGVSVDALAFCSIVARHSDEVRKMLKRFLKCDAVEGTSPVMAGTRATVEIFVSATTSAELLKDSCSVAEAIWAFACEVAFVTECAEAGEIVAAKIAAHELNGPVCFKVPRSGQKQQVEFDDDFNIRLLRNEVPIKRYKKLLQLGGELNAQGVSIVMQCGHRKSKLRAITPAATKPEWISIGTHESTTIATGYLPASRTVEMQIDEEVEVLSAPESADGLLRQALKQDVAIRVELESSKPSNPFLHEENRLKLVRVICLTELPGQSKLNLRDPDENPKTT